MTEIFKPIPGYEGRYSASNLGKVISHIRGNKEVRPKVTTNGYHYVSLSTGYTKPRTKSVGLAWLVAVMFVPNPENYQDIEIINGDKSDIRPDNIQWIKHNFKSRKVQPYEYLAWHQDNPDHVIKTSSMRQMAKMVDIRRERIEIYIWHIPGLYGPNGWAFERRLIPDFYLNRLIYKPKE